MKNIVLTRIDDRLIHGQVMTAWVHYTGCNKIVIIDDEVAKDEFLSMIMAAAVPSGIGIEIFGIADAAEFLKEEDDNSKIIILVKNPNTIYELLEKNVKLEKIILGGMGVKKDRTKLYRNIYVSDDEREILKKMLNKNITIQVQIIPNDNPLDIEKLL